MNLFNHDIKYQNIIDVVDGSKSLLVDIKYDDPFGARCSKRFSLDGEIIDHVRIAGTAISHVSVYHSVVTNVISSDRAEVLFNDKMIVCNSCEPMEFGTPILIFEHMVHDIGRFGEFDLMATRRYLQDFRLNSIQVIACDKDDNHIKIIYIDPYTGCVNDGGN